MKIEMSVQSDLQSRLEKLNVARSQQSDELAKCEALLAEAETDEIREFYTKLIAKLQHAIALIEEDINEITKLIPENR